MELKRWDVGRWATEHLLSSLSFEFCVWLYCMDFVSKHSLWPGGRCHGCSGDPGEAAFLSSTQQRYNCSYVMQVLGHSAGHAAEIPCCKGEGAGVAGSHNDT